MIDRAFGKGVSATAVLIGINVALFLFQSSVSPEFNRELISTYGLNREGLMAGYLWQPVTHMFLHGSLFHILVNMIALWFAGREIERTYGTRRFLVIYFLGGIIGGLVQTLFVPGSNLIGASGGVCAVLLAFTTTYPEMPITALLFFVLPINVKAKFLGYGVIVVSAAMGTLGIESNIGHLAHLGGALAGMAYALVFRKRFAPGGFPAFMPPPRHPAPPPAPRGPTIPAFFRKGPSPDELDHILAKVMKHGIHSLNTDERKALEQWSKERGQ